MSTNFHPTLFATILQRLPCRAPCKTTIYVEGVTLLLHPISISKDSIIVVQSYIRDAQQYWGAPWGEEVRSTQIDTQSELAHYSTVFPWYVVHPYLCVDVCKYFSLQFFCICVWMYASISVRRRIRSTVFGVSAAGTDRVETNIGTLMSLWALTTRTMHPNVNI